jgi:hypothetical protein
MPQRFPTLEEAGKAAIHTILEHSIEIGLEYAGLIVRVDDGFAFTQPLPGGPKNSDPGWSHVQVVGGYHTHGKSSPKHKDEQFSEVDIEWSSREALPLMLGTPLRRVMIYYPKGGIPAPFWPRGGQRPRIIFEQFEGKQWSEHTPFAIDYGYPPRDGHVILNPPRTAVLLRAWNHHLFPAH